MEMGKDRGVNYYWATSNLWMDGQRKYQVWLDETVKIEGLFVKVSKEERMGILDYILLQFMDDQKKKFVKIKDKNSIFVKK